MNFGSVLLWNEKTYVNYSTTFLVVNTIFSRVHATLHPALSIRPLVGWSVSHIYFFIRIIPTNWFFVN